MNFYYLSETSDHDNYLPQYGAAGHTKRQQALYPFFSSSIVCANEQAGAREYKLF